MEEGGSPVVAAELAFTVARIEAAFDTILAWENRREKVGIGTFGDAFDALAWRGGVDDPAK